MNDAPRLVLGRMSRHKQLRELQTFHNSNTLRFVIHVRCVVQVIGASAARLFVEPPSHGPTAVAPRPGLTVIDIGVLAFVTIATLRAFVSARRPCCSRTRCVQALRFTIGTGVSDCWGNRSAGNTSCSRLSMGPAVVSNAGCSAAPNDGVIRPNTRAQLF